MQRLPGFFVDLGLEGGFERLIWVIGPQEIGMAHEEAFLVVVGVDEPAGDALGPVAADFAGVGVEHVYAVDLHLDLSIFCVQDVDIRLAEDDKQVALAGVLQIIGHVQIGVHPCLEHRDAAQLVEIRRVSIVVESAGDERVKVGVTRLTSRRHKIRAGNGAELRANEDRGTFL